MTEQAVAPYLANLPNYANMVGARTENISQQLRGQLPEDVIRQMQQQAAERGIGTGTSGSPNNNAAYLRALGLNSLQMQQTGNQNLTTAIADTPVPQLFNPMSLYVPMTLAQQAEAAARRGQQAGGSGGGRPGGGYSVVGGPSGPRQPSSMTPFSSFGGGNAPGSTLISGGYEDPFASQRDIMNFQSPAWDQYGASASGVDFSTPQFDPTSYLTAYDQSNGTGGNVDWSGLYNDPNLPASWADQQWGGYGDAFNQIDASNPDNAFMFE